MRYFQYTGDNDIVVISDDKKNYNLKSYRRLSYYTSYAEGTLIANTEYVTCFDIPISSTTEIVSFYIEESRKTYYGIRATPGTNKVVVEVHYYSGTVFDADDIIVYIFDVGVYLSDNFGLEIKDENGNGVFHSSDFALNVVSAASIKETSKDGTVHHAWSYAYGNKKVAYSFSSSSSYSWVEIYGFFDVAMRARSFPLWHSSSASNTLCFYYAEMADIYASGESADIAFYAAFGQFAATTEILVIDVTNAPRPA